MRKKEIRKRNTKIDKDNMFEEYNTTFLYPMLHNIYHLNNFIYNIFVAGLFLEMTLPDNCIFVPRRAFIISGIITYAIVVFNRD